MRSRSRKGNSVNICIDMGHTPTSPGASGYLDELREDRIIGGGLIAEMRRRGHAVTDTTAPDWMGYPNEINHRVAAANGSGAELFVSIHLNAGGGTGPEVLYFAGDGYGLSTARQISANLASVLGLPDRGAKARTNEIGVIRDTYMTAVLVEVCFVDSAKDKAAYDAVSYDAIVNAIADGIEGSAASGGPAPAPAPSDSIDDLARRAIAGEFGNGADRKAALGADYDAVQARVNEMLGAGSAPSGGGSGIDDLARRAINGEFGNGDARKAALGADYAAVQARVNEMLGAGSGGSAPSVDIDALAHAVIRGVYGNGDARRAALGGNYDAVQRRVNEMLS